MIVKRFNVVDFEKAYGKLTEMYPDIKSSVPDDVMFKRAVASACNKYGDIEYDEDNYQITYRPDAACDFETRYAGSDFYLKYIGEETDGSKIKIPDGIKSIRYMFVDSNIVIPPVIPNTVTDMDHAFCGSYGLKEPPAIPNSVKKIVCAFECCDNLETAPVIPDSVIDMYKAFSGCEKLKQPPVIPNSVEDMTAAFAYCYSLETVPVIPDSVKCREDVFKGCDFDNVPIQRAKHFSAKTEREVLETVNIDMLSDDLSIIYGV